VEYSETKFSFLLTTLTEVFVLKHEQTRLFTLLHLSFFPGPLMEITYLPNVAKGRILSLLLQLSWDFCL